MLKVVIAHYITFRYRCSTCKDRYWTTQYIFQVLTVSLTCWSLLTHYGHASSTGESKHFYGAIKSATAFHDAHAVFVVSWNVSVIALCVSYRVINGVQWSGGLVSWADTWWRNCWIEATLFLCLTSVRATSCLASPSTRETSATNRWVWTRAAHFSPLSMSPLNPKPSQT